MKTLAFFTLFELAAACAWGTTRYEYQGEPFAVVTGIYQPGDRITGSFTLDDAPITTFTPWITHVEAHVLDFAFTDGHQTFTTPTSLGVPVTRDGALIIPATLGRDWFWDVEAGSLSTAWYLHEGSDFVSLGASIAFNCEALAGCVLGTGETPRGTWTVSTPEPATLTLLGIGCVGLVLARRWRR